MQPKITIIIPVYNVEQYLRQCLDSVAYQTLHDLQILCVDHSSTDGSLAILEEFAAKDDRFEIIHCENTGGGPGQARNAGLPHVKGKYLYFVDSDDWLDLMLCEKAYYRLEQSGGDIMFFSAHDVAEASQCYRKLNANVNGIGIQPDASDCLRKIMVVPWNRVVRTSYLENIGFRFPDVNCSEDTFFHWISLVHQPRIICLPQKLYYYRLHSSSLMALKGEYMVGKAKVCDLIKQHLLETGIYKAYRERFLTYKFDSCFWAYNHVLPEHKDKVTQNLLETLDDDEIAFIKEGKHISPAVRDFYLGIFGLNPKTESASPPHPPTTFRQQVKAINRRVFRPLEKSIKRANRTVMRPLENFIRRLLGKPKKIVPSISTASVQPKPVPMESNTDRQIRELSGLVCQLSKEVVELREQLNEQSLIEISIKTAA